MQSDSRPIIAWNIASNTRWGEILSAGFPNAQRARFAPISSAAEFNAAVSIRFRQQGLIGSTLRDSNGVTPRLKHARTNLLVINQNYQNGSINQRVFVLLLVDVDRSFHFPLM